MKVAIASDHAGIEGRRAAKRAAEAAGADVVEHGPEQPESVDYPDFAHEVAGLVESGEVDFGILVCGTGLGMSMAANRHPGVRAAVVTDEFTAKMCRAHNDANIACFGERVIGTEQIEALTKIFLAGEFEGDRHSRRVGKIER